MNNEEKEHSSVLALEYCDLFIIELKSFCNSVIIKESNEQESNSQNTINAMLISILYGKEMVAGGFASFNCGLTLEEGVGQFLRAMYHLNEAHFKNLSFFQKLNKDNKFMREKYKMFATYASGSLRSPSESNAERFLVVFLKDVSENK